MEQEKKSVTDKTWYDVDFHTPEVNKKEGHVLPVKVKYEDGIEDVCGWCDGAYYTYDGEVKKITHFQFM